MSVYANAADVLPSELLKAVQKHWRGLLYIPPVNYKSKADKNFVQNMVASGTPIGEVADMIGLTPRRIYQIQSDSPHGGFIRSRRKTGNSRCTRKPSVTFPSLLSK